MLFCSLTFTNLLIIAISIAERELGEPFIAGLICSVAIGVAGAIVRSFQRRAYQVRREAFMRGKRFACQDLVNRLERQDTVTAALAGPHAWAARILREFPGDTNRARILCFGFVEVPDTFPYSFEPEILNATDLMWRRLIWLWPAVLIAVWISLQQLGFLPGSPGWASSFYFLTTVLGTLGYWFWSSSVRPSYVRIAPGIVQFLQFWKGRPSTIRSYPMTEGTTVVVRQSGKYPVFEFQRENATDCISIDDLRDKRGCETKLWRALLSSAPIPRLSEDDLLG